MAESGAFCFTPGTDVRLSQVVSRKSSAVCGLVKLDGVASFSPGSDDLNANTGARTEARSYTSWPARLMGVQGRVSARDPEATGMVSRLPVGMGSSLRKWL